MRKSSSRLSFAMEIKLSFQFWRVKIRLARIPASRSSFRSLTSNFAFHKMTTLTRFDAKIDLSLDFCFGNQALVRILASQTSSRSNFGCPKPVSLDNVCKKRGTPRAHPEHTPSTPKHKKNKENEGKHKKQVPKRTREKKKKNIARSESLQ